MWNEGGLYDTVELIEPDKCPPWSVTVRIYSVLLINFEGRQVILPLVVAKANPNWNLSKMESPKRISCCGGLVPALSRLMTCAPLSRTGPLVALCPVTPGLSRQWRQLSRTNSWPVPALQLSSRRTASPSSLINYWLDLVLEIHAVSTTPTWSPINCWAGLTPVISEWKNYMAWKITSCSARLTPVPPSHPKLNFSRNLTQRAGGSLLPQGLLVS